MSDADVSNISFKEGDRLSWGNNTHNTLGNMFCRSTFRTALQRSPMPFHLDLLCDAMLMPLAACTMVGNEVENMYFRWVKVTVLF